ncbi:MAG: Gfo/Idh/MocA family oxidoreductase [Candidatus Hydrogenedentes bacterium]|jgi:predicted dehydrogenase|nr:Gfo/Idh/MocA family oxidoreductase [Candidatus Hydrogenedentota bacterium]
MSKVLRIGFIGAGGIAPGHYERLSKTGKAEVTALTDPSDASLSRFYERCPTSVSLPVYGDYRDMIKKEDLDGVLILSPHTVHYAQIRDSLKRGLHVLTEKPMVCTIQHAQKLIQQAKDVDRVLMISYQRHFDPMFRYMRDQIKKGSIGTVEFVQAVLSQEWLRITRNTWRQELESSGGGQLNDSGSHLIDILMWVTGMKIRQVSAVSENFDIEVDVNSSLSLLFENGALGSLSIIGNAPAWHEDHTIIGSKGAFYLRQGIGLVQQNAAGESVNFKLPKYTDNPDNNFINTILGKATAETPPECGLNVIELTEAAWKSAAAGGKPVRLR